MTWRRLLSRSRSVVMLVVACAQGELERPREPREPAVLGGIMQAATAVSGFVDELIVSGIASPTAFAFAPDGRIFVAQQDGRVRVVRDGSLLAQDFATLPVSSEGERGLLGIAIDPNFASNSYLYVYYTAPTPAVHNRVSRLRALGDVAEAGSETALFELDDVGGCPIHMGGAIHFGADGRLYIAVGDSCDSARAQRLDALAGKILRIAADGSIPADNPFYANTSGSNRAIWALGLRNPYTFAFSRAGRMFINDVGNGAWEEIDEGFAGANYGWPDSEGATNTPGHTGPVFAYPHNDASPSGCAITGAAFYDPVVPQYPSSYLGKYFFGEYCRGFVRSLDPASYTSQEFLEEVSAPVDLAVAPDGLLYRLERGTGSIARVRYAAEQAPVITAQPADRTVSVTGSVTFTASASGTQPLGYQWQRNGLDIAGASAASYTFTAAMADHGARFRVLVTNAFGTVISRDATLTVVQNAAPTAVIDSPAQGTSYRGDDSVAFSGSGSDPEDGALPASAFSWEVVFHHDTHTHPFLAPFSGQRSGSFDVPRIGHTETNVFYRIHLRVRDSLGLERATFRDVTPRLSTLTLQTDPPGLSVTLDGVPVTAPRSVPSVVGVTRSLGVLSPQTVGGTTYVFQAWSDLGTATHAVDTPAVDTVYTAAFAAQTGCAASRLPISSAASSSLEAPDLGASRAVDGDPGTRWSSAFADNQWLSVDLGQPRQVERAVLSWETASAADYRLELSSDGANWSTIRSLAGMPAGARIDALNDLAAHVGRYLRVFGARRATQWGFSLFELELYGDENAGCQGPAACGNGAREAGEACDDGNSANGDGCSASCQVENTGCSDVALSRAAAVSSSDESADLTAARAIDGDLSTRWSSAFSDPQWLNVDLGATRQIGRVVVHWEIAHARDYQIEVAANPAGPWTTVSTRTNFGGGTDAISGLSASARYVRMAASARGTGWGNSLWEFQIFGDPDPGCAQ